VGAIRAASSRVAMGHVRRVAIVLDRPITELLDDARRARLARTAFVQARGAVVPVWWTSYPFESPLVIGWAGGPAAMALDRLGAALPDRALASLADSWGIDLRRLRRHHVRTLTHDWARDAFSRGAYSYPMVGGSEAAQALARPVRSTLFFAGEATDAEGRTATVHGAIASGYRAAAQARRVLGRG
jgi:monoamine oxidase